MSEGDSFTRSGEDGTRGLVPGYVPPQERTARGGFCFERFFHTLGAWERHREGGALLPFVLRACCEGMCWPVDRPGTHAAAGAAARGALIFCFERGRALLPFVLRVVAEACVGRWTGQPRMPPRERLHERLGGGGDCFTCSGATDEGGRVLLCFVEQRRERGDVV